MLLSYNQLVSLVSSGVVDGVPKAHINGTSIDVTLGSNIWIEGESKEVIDLSDKKTPRMVSVKIPEEGFVLRPQEFILAQTAESFNLPNWISCEFKLKSSSARAGLDNALATWCDPTWHGSVLTLELRNNLQHQSLLLKTGMKIGQMIFFQSAPVPDNESYANRGQYNNDTEAQPSRGNR